MRAAVLQGPRDLLVTDVAEPLALPGEVVVEVDLAGVCGSDLALFQGHRPIAYPQILGHEAVGRLLGDGARVVIEPNIPCGTCGVCRRGKGNVCPEKRSLGLNRPGVFAERVAVPAEFVHPLPAEIEPVDAVGIEPLAVAVHAVDIAGATAGDHVAVVGCGAEGLLIVQVALAMGLRVLTADTRAEALAMAERLGASAGLLLSQTHVEDDLARVHEEWSPAVVFEAAGAASAVGAALTMVADGGSVVVLGLAETPIELVPLRFVRRGLRLLSSLIYDHPRDFRSAIELVRSGRIRPSAHVAHVSCLGDAPDALRNIAAGRPGKTVLEIAQAAGGA